MTLKNPKFPQTNKNLLKNFDLGEELEDKNGEKISGGAIFSFQNMTPDPINVILLNGAEIPLIIEPFGEVGAIQQSIPGHLITVQFNPIPGGAPENNPVMERMPSNRIGIFDREDNMIVFFLE